MDIDACSTNFNYASTVNLNGIAQFQKRGLSLVSESGRVTNMTLSDPLTEFLPIGRAEIAVYNGNNQLVQCGQTDLTGQFKSLTGTSLKIPATAGSYYVLVRARSIVNYGGADNKMNFVVRKDVYQNEIHSIRKDFSVTSAPEVSFVVQAFARQVDSEFIEGGAFNILNSLQLAFDYIKSSTTANTTCMSNPLDIYWKPGFNPVQYEDPNADPATLSNTSYYSIKSKRLFISGGQLGNISMANTDHFDDFAIVHEYGHFLEDFCGQWTSPGGNHTLTSRIDPRLAWSEAWANYIATQVLNAKLDSIDPTLRNRLQIIGETYGWTYFFNSSGFSDSIQGVGNGNGFMIDFKLSGAAPGQWPMGSPYAGVEFDRVIPTLYPGEGHFREGAISRSLFKVANTCGTYCTTSAIDFDWLWASFDKITGIGASRSPFLSSHDFFENLKARVIAENIVSKPFPEAVLVGDALQLRSSGSFLFAATPPATADVTRWVPYAQKFVRSTVACDLRIQARPDDAALSGGQSDPRYSNHFMTLDFADADLQNLDQISVRFEKVTGSNIDHDLILFKPNYAFNYDYECTGGFVGGFCQGSWAPSRTINEHVVRSNRNVATTASTNFSKALTGLSSLDKSNLYLLNIRAYTALPSPPLTTTEYKYQISLGAPVGGFLCPQ